MKLSDLATGSDWIVWIVFVIFAVLSIILLSGHGSWFISGYNTASKEEKKKYDEKKLCRTCLLYTSPGRCSQRPSPRRTREYPAYRNSRRAPEPDFSYIL